MAESPAITGNEGSTDLQREHRFDAFAGGEDVGRLAEAHTIAEQMAEGTARIGERRLVGSPWIEPGALNAGDIAVEVGDGSKQRRPAFERSIVRLAVVDRRVIAQGGPVEPSGDATGPQISFGQRAGNGVASTKQAARRFGRGGRGWWHMTEIRRRWDRGTRQGEKAARFVHRLAKIAQVAVEADQVQEIAMLAGRVVGLMFNCT